MASGTRAASLARQAICKANLPRGGIWVMSVHQTWFGRVTGKSLDSYGYILCAGCFLLVLGSWYPLVHVNMHCRAVDRDQPHQLHQPPHPSREGRAFSATSPTFVAFSLHVAAHLP